ncbi:MAG: nuclear transport factor 2 family protein [Myxococcaceae bacterium]|nr:nuclear transport factor 2 family protein [Myxococcaceae bacterium]
MPGTRNQNIARQWLKAFNAHDVKALVSLYDENCRHTSPKLRTLLPESDGMIRGKPALEAWWTDALTRLPSLRYEEVSVTADEKRAFIEYLRHVTGETPLLVAEVFEIENGFIVASRVYHG